MSLGLSGDLRQPLTGGTSPYDERGYPSAPPSALPASALPPPAARDQVILMSNTTENHMRLLLPKMKELNKDLASSRKCDCARQVVGAIFCGIFCLPCAGVRLVRNCKGLDPMKVEVFGKPCKVPGLEYCSAADCSQICGSDDRGYGHPEYTMPQESGSGFARSTLDQLNILGVTIISTLLTIKAATS